MPRKSARADSTVGGSPGRSRRYISTSASSGFRCVSRVSVSCTEASFLSGSSKTTLKGATGRAAIFASSFEFRSWFASRSTSPVFESTTRPPVRRFSSHAMGTWNFAIPASTMRSTRPLFRRRPACTIGSRCRGCLMSSATGVSCRWISGFSLTTAAPSSKLTTSSRS